MVKIKEGFKGERSIVLPASFIQEIQKDPLGKELYITDIGFYPHASFHYRERSHAESNEYVLIYCVEGEGWFQIGNQQHTVTANQFFILPKHTSHAYGSNIDNPWTIYWMHFNGEKAAYFSANFQKPSNITPQQDSRINERLHLFEEIFSALSHSCDKKYMLYATTSLFHFLGSMKFLGEYRGVSTMHYQQGDIIQKTIHYMQENIGKQIYLKELADISRLSPSHFSKIFEEKTGFPPLKYLNHLRIQEACHYLINTDLKISQISPLVGIKDPLYFSRLFTKVMKTTPSAYRVSKKI